nr:MAG TPA: minor capsid protein [Caudoviricetes sp.]
MLTPDELKVVPDNIVKIYQDLEDDIISDIARRLQKAGEITDTADWQMYMLGQIGNDLEEIKSKIAKANKMSKDEVDKLFINATDRSMYYENIAYKKAGKKTLSLYDSATMMKFVAANAKKTHGELKNLTKSLGFKSGDSFKSVAKTYQDTLNYAQFQVASGAFSYQDAVRTAIRTLTESGLRVVDYESGVSNMLDVAVRRATLTGINQTVAEITLMQMKESDSEFVEVTAHMGARPDHQTWQGKVYHVGGDKDGYPDFEESTGYGTGAGLCGWNCRHSFFVFFPGISVRNYTDEQLKNIDPPSIEYDGKTYTYYEATQKQRQIERMIRKTKRELVALDSAGLKSDFTAKSVRLRKQKDLYVDFSKSAKLKTRNERHQVYGFNKSVGSKSSWANRKNIVDKNAVKGYNKDEEVIRAIDNNKKISEINKQRAIELYYSFKNEGIYASDHFIEQYIEREFKNNGDLNYDFEKIIEIAKKEHNYVDMTNGRYVIYYDNIGIVKEVDKYITIIKGRVSKHWETIE